MADMAKGKRVGGSGSADGRSGQSDFPNLDFLGNPTVHLANLKPGKDGTVTLDISKLSGQQHLHVVALDAQTIVSRNVNLPSSDLPSRENRMARTLDPEKPSSEQKLISFRGKDDAFELADITSSRLQVYDSLDKVFTLLLTLSGQNSHLTSSVILGWPSMERKAKLEKYSKYSCHELNFSYHKDRPFFEKIIQPYLANKKIRHLWIIGSLALTYLTTQNHGPLIVLMLWRKSSLHVPVQLARMLWSASYKTVRICLLTPTVSNISLIRPKEPLPKWMI